MDLTAHLLDLEAIDGFVRDVAGEGAGGGGGGGGGAAHSLRLLHRQPELFAKGERILRKSIAPARAVTVDDLPRETAERGQQLARVEELERLLRVKDAMLWSMLNDGRAKEAAQAESSRRLEEARVAVQTVERGSRDELAQWGALAEEYQQRLDAVQGSLAAQQQQAAQLGAENQQLRTHNGQLLEYGERLRAQLQALHEEEEQHAVEQQYQQQQQAGEVGVAGAVFA